MIAARQAALADARRVKARHARGRLFAIAASLLIGLVGISGYWWLVLPDDYRTAIGERRVITLSDGSKLSLDADSEVTVRYGKHDRSLHLLKGQARFDVAHDKTRPFSVVAGNQKVIATGTAFNIDMAGPKVLVTLIEGHVVVLDEIEGSTTMPAVPGRHVVELKAGQQLAAGARGAAPDRARQHPTGHRLDPRPDHASMTSRCSSVVDRVNRYGGTQIVIASPEVGAMKISGVFNAGDTLGFVEIVTHYLPVKAVSESPHTHRPGERAQEERNMRELEGSLRTIPFPDDRTRDKCPDNKKGRHAQGAETRLVVAHRIGSEPLPGFMRQPRFGTAEIQL